MPDMTRRISRRTFVMGFGGGAASASLVWGLWGFRRWPQTPGEEHPVIARCCAYAEYDGWLVTTEDKRRLPLIIVLTYTSGWYRKETGGETPGRWTHQAATLSFLNPQANATFSLDYAARAKQTVTVSVGGQLLQSFVTDASGRRRCRRILLPAAVLGNGDRAEIQITVDRTFVPANLIVGSRDARELGIKVYHAAVERDPVPTP